MTIDRMALKALLEKGSDHDLLREMMAYVASRMMDAEVESLTGAGLGERSAGRTNQRNGYRVREWHTGVGTVPVAISKLRKGSYFPLVPGTSPGRRQGAGRGHPEGVCARRLDALGR